MPDYADWTESIELLGTEIQVPIDIQGTFIQLPVDIQGQYVTLKMDIVAQTVGNIAIDIAAQTVGNISVNIAASAVTMNVAIQSSAVTLNVNIAASAVTFNVNIAASAVTINMDIKAQTVAVKTQGEWSPQAGQQKFFRALNANAAPEGTAVSDYVVTAGKTLFITHLSGAIQAVAAADKDKDQICYINVMDLTTTTFLAEMGGHGGAGISLPTPAKIPGGNTFRCQIHNHSNHNCEIYMTAGGYEI